MRERRPRRTWGSSPRVRGKPPQRALIAFIRGLIPACAGKTVSFQGMNVPRPAHPRVCGENVPPAHVSRFIKGSSPRVRGKLVADDCAGGVVGLIPACAGKTKFAPVFAGVAGAHPRVCGENCECGVEDFRGAGSSPRVRGKLVLCVVYGAEVGLIPACAGKTW